MSARTNQGFTLMEVVFAVAIVATALAALQATVAGSIQSAGSTVNRRAAREECRAKLEEILAGSESPDGGGDFEDRPGFKWSARSEEVSVGMPDKASEVVKIVVVEVTFPVFADTGPAGAEGAAAPTGSAEEGTETITMGSVLAPPEEEAAPGTGQ
jgi:prepilin-type N-terminal cleavage/methylation domain-containing protein